MQRYKMVDARLRRLCEKKPSGKLNVPQSIHDQWMAGGRQRDELRALLEQFDFDKEPFLWTHYGGSWGGKKNVHAYRMCMTCMKYMCDNIGF